jgi:hypothetical protein
MRHFTAQSGFHSHHSVETWPHTKALQANRVHLVLAASTMKSSVSHKAQQRRICREGSSGAATALTFLPPALEALDLHVLDAGCACHVDYQGVLGVPLGPLQCNIERCLARCISNVGMHTKLHQCPHHPLQKANHHMWLHTCAANWN